MFFVTVGEWETTGEQKTRFMSSDWAVHKFFWIALFYFKFWEFSYEKSWYCNG